MSRQKSPRLYELKSLFENDAQELTFLKHLEERLSEPLAKDVLTRWEAVLQTLDSNAWEVLKSKIGTRTGFPDKKGRGWQQIYDLMNEARAFRYLQSMGCKELCLIPESMKQGQKTPDIEGALGTKRLLCEVKTINTSDAEIFNRKERTVGKSFTELPAGLLNQLLEALERAGQQIRSYRDDSTDLRFVYLAIEFDDFTGEYKEELLAQIDQAVFKQWHQELRIVVWNRRTLFYKPLHLAFAEVDNLDDSYPLHQ